MSDLARLGGGMASLEEALRSMAERLGGEAGEAILRGLAAPADPDAIPADRERVWHAACARGDCRYANLHASAVNGPAVDSTQVCGGYHGAKYIEYDEHGEPMTVWRWRPCVRHLRWLKAHREWLKEQKRKAKAAKAEVYIPDKDWGRGHDDDD